MKAREVFSIALIDALAKAGEYADDASLTIDERVHGFRRAVRRARGLLRVARAGIDDETRGRLNEMLRSANASTSALRDSAVLFDALDALGEDPALDAARERARAALEAQLAVSSQNRNPERVLSTAAEGVATVRLVLESVKLQELGGSDVAKAIGELWEKATDARTDAIFSGDRDDFHVWRKRTKEIRAGVQALVDAGAPLAGLLHDLKLAARAQGEITDAFVLRDALKQVDFSGVEESAEELFDAIDEQVTLGMRQVIAEFALPFEISAQTVRRKIRRAIKEGLKNSAKAAGEAIPEDDEADHDEEDGDVKLALNAGDPALDDSESEEESDEKD